MESIIRQNRYFMLCEKKVQITAIIFIIHDIFENVSNSTQVFQFKIHFRALNANLVKAEKFSIAVRYVGYRYTILIDISAEEGHQTNISRVLFCYLNIFINFIRV